jgi:nitrogen fixation NifU-like protein
MNSDELYLEVLLQHSRRPKNHGPLEKVTHRAEGYNALCTASASIMTCEAIELTETEVITLASSFRKLATDGVSDSETSNRPALEVMGTIHRFPQQVKCATLPWEALPAALREGAIE